MNSATCISYARQTYIEKTGAIGVPPHKDIEQNVEEALKDARSAYFHISILQNTAKVKDRFDLREEMVRIQEAMANCGKVPSKYLREPVHGLFRKGLRPRA